jgi:hypothetical protein
MYVNTSLNFRDIANQWSIENFSQFFKKIKIDNKKRTKILCPPSGHAVRIGHAGGLKNSEARF